MIVPNHIISGLEEVWMASKNGVEIFC